MMITTLTILLHYTSNILPLHLHLHSPHPALQTAHYLSFVVSIFSCQAVIVITYKLDLPLHFLSAGLFFASAALCIFLKTYLDYTTHPHVTEPSRLRFGLSILSSLLMLSSLLALLFTTFTYSLIKQFDRRPPVLWGELIGIVAFVTHCMTLLPILQPEQEGKGLWRTGKHSGGWEECEQQSEGRTKLDNVVVGESSL